MTNRPAHLSDEDLVLQASGEPASSPDAQARAHLEFCFHCRERLRKLEESLAEFSEAHRTLSRSQMPPADRARLSLQSRLAQMTAKDRESSHRFPPAFVSRRTLVAAGIALSACVVLAMSLRRPATSHSAIVASIAYSEEPDLRLTPGATILVTQNDICGNTKPTPSIPVSLQQKVFRLYKVTEPPDQFEVDYLITPQLGGATDIRNLWPEPYHDAVWNAHVKDQLEDHLHHMVCRGDLDLATAQHDISSDWIAAYRKYFHTERPIADGTTSNFSSSRKLLPRT